MKILGSYEELWPAVAGGGEGELGDHVREEGEADEERLVRYLRDGEEIFSAMGVVGDLLGSDERILGGDSLFTDGEWVWRGDLWFYVSRYHLRLPEEFLARVRLTDYHVPAVAHDTLVAVWEDVKRFL